MEGSEIKEEANQRVSERKKIFVAGATGSTGKRIVEQLLAKGFAVKAGVRDLEKAKSTFQENNPDLQFVSSRVQFADLIAISLYLSRLLVILFYRLALHLNGGWFGNWQKCVLFCVN